MKFIERGNSMPRFKFKGYFEFEQDGESFYEAMRNFDGNLTSLTDYQNNTQKFLSYRLISYDEITLPEKKAIERVYCDDVSFANSFIENKLSVSGWINSIRDKGGILFIVLRDCTGFVQCVIEKSRDEVLYEKAKVLTNESVITISGRCVERESLNKDMRNGDVEILVEDVEIHNIAEPLPFNLQFKAQ